MVSTDGLSNAPAHPVVPSTLRTDLEPSDLGDRRASTSLLPSETPNRIPVMALWKESTAPAKEAPPIMTPSAEPAFKRDPEPSMDIAPQAPRRVAPREGKESVVAAEITITGTNVGTGHVRIAGRFEGDVHIEGNLSIEEGAKLTGGIRANSVAIAGEVEGNVDHAAKVELLSTGVLNGDLKAGTLTVAAGSRMRGRAEFGWGDANSASSPLTLESRQAS
jgi:cytoskeletal protein CcmA (bactofilin family)